MPNDAKLAMVIGVGIVVAVAIVFFHKDLVNGRGPGDRPPANGVNPPGGDPAAPASGPRRLVAGQPTGLVKAAADVASSHRRRWRHALRAGRALSTAMASASWTSTRPTATC